jgi:hypothetical protein
MPGFLPSFAGAASIGLRYGFWEGDESGSQPLLPLFNTILYLDSGNSIS